MDANDKCILRAVGISKNPEGLGGGGLLKEKVLLILLSKSKVGWIAPLSPWFLRP